MGSHPPAHTATVRVSMEMITSHDVGTRGSGLGTMGGHHLQRTGRTGPGGTGSPAQGVVGASCKANGGPLSSENRAHRPGGDGGLAKGVFGASCKAYGGPSSSENRAHRPGGDGESSPGGGRSLLQGPWGAIIPPDARLLAMGQDVASPSRDGHYGAAAYPLDSHRPSGSGSFQVPGGMCGAQMPGAPE